MREKKTQYVQLINCGTNRVLICVLSVYIITAIIIIVVVVDLMLHYKILCILYII